MQIAGVRNIVSSKIRKIRVDLDPSYANGHDFCELMVDETANRFTAVLYGGESYTFSWASPGDSFIKFLIDIFSRKDEYLYEKLADYSKEKFIDTDKTGNHLKNLLLKARRNREIDKDEAEDMWDNIERMQAEHEMSEAELYGIWNGWFDKMIERQIISDEPWFEDFIEHERDWKCLTFCGKVAPILAEVLKHEYQVTS